jgi:hypothetical protein
MFVASIAFTMAFTHRDYFPKDKVRYALTFSYSGAEYRESASPYPLYFSLIRVCVRAPVRACACVCIYTIIYIPSFSI